MDERERAAARALGELLRAARKELGISQASVAEQVGKTETWIRHVEKGVPDGAGGHRPVRPSPDLLVRWAWTVGVDPVTAFTVGGLDVQELPPVTTGPDRVRRRLVATIGELDPADLREVELAVARLLDRTNLSQSDAERG